MVPPGCRPGSRFRRLPGYFDSIFAISIAKCKERVPREAKCRLKRVGIFRPARMAGAAASGRRPRVALEADHAIAPGTLGLVQRLVGALDQGFGAVAVIRTDGDAHRDGDGAGGA